MKILIIDDDETLGRALEEAFKRSGYNSKWVSNPDEAQFSFKINEYSIVILDCMLPKVNGIQLIESLNKTIGIDFKLFLISGVFRDRSFINDALHKTKALGFFSKPFDAQLLVDNVTAALSSPSEEREPLYQLMIHASPSSNDFLRAIHETKMIHGFDLLLVYSLLTNSELSGYLHMVNSEGEKSSIIVQSGKIIQANIKDKNSYFGSLLVEHGYTSDEEVLQMLSQPSQRPIGERLVEANAMSPHAIHIIRREQLIIRLSKTIQDSLIKVRFVLQEVPSNDQFIDSNTILLLLRDWVISKLTLNWLRAYYTSWLDYSIKQITQEKSKISLTHSLSKSCQEILSLVNNNRTLQEILNTSIYSEEKILRSIHLLLLEKNIIFEKKRHHSIDHESKLKRYQRILEEMKTQNFFEILGVNKQAKDKEINKAYIELAKSLHPDKIDLNASEALKQAQHQVFSRISEAYDRLKDNERRESYLHELTSGLTNDLLRTETKFDHAINLLERGNYQKALLILEEISQEKQHRSDLIVYLVWAKIKVGYSNKNQEKFIEELSDKLNRIPPEERHTVLFIFVKGLYLKTIGKIDKAYNYFKHAATMDPAFSAAKREMMALENDHRRTKTADLSHVVSLLFNNKGKGARSKR